jgi:hypothetical protein
MTPFPSPKQGMPIPPPAKARRLPGPGSVMCPVCDVLAKWCDLLVVLYCYP